MKRCVAVLLLSLACLGLSPRPATGSFMMATSRTEAGSVLLGLAAQGQPVFADVPATHWAFRDIELLAQRGYVAGCSETPRLYCPDASMTRAESAVFVERGIHGAGAMPPQPETRVFADVPLAEWFAKWVDALWKDGYTAGCSTQPLAYCPLHLHTRAEATVFFERMQHGRDFQPREPSQSFYTDVPAGAWYEKWIHAAFQDGLLQECEDPAERADTRFRPEEQLTRAEAACMMVRAKALLPPSSAFYVDNSRPVSGNGSLGSPFKTIAEGLAMLQPGGVLILRGDAQGRIYNETLDFPRPGAAMAPITVKAYPGEKVIIASSSMLFTLDQPYWRLEGLIFDHQNGAGDAIQIRGGHYSVLSGVEIRNGKRNGVQIFDANHLRIENSSIHTFSTGTPGNDAHCLITDPTSPARTVENLELVNNTIFDCSGDGIQFYASTGTPPSEYARNVLIQGNTFYKNPGFYGENAIDAKGADSVQVIDNEIYGFDTNKAVVLQKGSSHFTFEGNTIHDSHRGIEMRGEDGLSQSGHRLYRNIFYNIFGEYVIKFDDVHGAVVQHNTLAQNSAQSFRIEEQGLTQGDIRNNLIYQTATPSITGTFEANVGSNGWFSASGGSLSRTSDATGSDALFVNPAAHDYHLRPGSPVVDVGVDVGQPYAGRAPDLGAFELE